MWWAAATPKLTCRADRHIDRLVRRAATVFIHVHTVRAAVVIGRSRGHAQLSCIVTARSSDRAAANTAGRMGCEVAAAVGRTPGTERTAGVVATELVAVARLIFARPVAAILPSRAALFAAAGIARLVAARPAAAYLAGSVAAAFIFVTAVGTGARTAGRAEWAAEVGISRGKAGAEIAAEIAVDTEVASAAATATAGLVWVSTAGALATERIAVEAPRVVDLVDALAVFADRATG